MGKLKSGANKVAYEAEKVARSSRARNELDTLKNQVKAQYYKIGELYYQKRSTGVTGPEFDTLCQAVVDLEGQIKAKEEEIQKITAETFESQSGQTPVTSGAPVSVPPAAQPAAPAPAPAVQAAPASAAAPSSFPTQVNAPAQTKVCPACGKEIPAAVKFCPECGKPV
ncbi:MAG: zinc ribbon domain-containing protein [Anaerolineaceae bacterium]